MSPEDIIFYFGEYRGAKWSHFFGDKFNELVKLVSLSIVSFGLSKDAFMKFMNKEIDSWVSYLQSSSPDGEMIHIGKVPEPIQGDLPF